MQEKTEELKLPWKRISSHAFRYLHYLGIIFAVAMLAETWQSTRDADESLSRSVQQQQNLRNIMWMNLLIQRSTGMALSANELKDAAYLERAKTLADSIEQHMDQFSDKPSDQLDTMTRQGIIKDGQMFRKQLELYVAKRTTLIELTGAVDQVGADLNRIESEEWYLLSERNQLLLSQVKKGHAILVAMLAMFVGYLVLLGWILKRKEKAEAALLEAEAKMLNSAKISALGEMAGGVAHEINNPLAVIGLITEQVREILEEKRDENQLVIEMLTRVSKTVTRIAVIVQGLRTFSRDASNDKFSSASLSEVIHSTLSLCQEKFRSKDIAVSIDIDPPNLTALCQQVQISQVLLNLLNNSCDAILPLQDKWIKISATVGGLGVRLSVTDSGNGIKKEIDDKIFNPFFTTKEVGKGTGLGLSISRGIMEAHHGKISLNPKCANTCFVIELPQGETQEKLVGRMA